MWAQEVCLWIRPCTGLCGQPARQTVKGGILCCYGNCKRHHKDFGIARDEYSVYLPTCVNQFMLFYTS